MNEVRRNPDPTGMGLSIVQRNQRACQNVANWMSIKPATCDANSANIEVNAKHRSFLTHMQPTCKIQTYSYASAVSLPQSQLPSHLTPSNHMCSNIIGLTHGSRLQAHVRKWDKLTRWPQTEWRREERRQRCEEQETDIVHSTERHRKVQEAETDAAKKVLYCGQVWGHLSRWPQTSSLQVESLFSFGRRASWRGLLLQRTTIWFAYPTGQNPLFAQSHSSKSCPLRVDVPVWIGP